MKVPDVVTLDFETEKIEARPNFPPAPVGLSAKFPGERAPTYYTGEDMRRVYLRAVKSDYPLLCHNNKFDLAVGEKAFGVPLPPWERCHDTLFLLFLSDPHSPSLALKPSAERILGMKPGERDLVREWLVAQKIVKKNQGDWGAFISKVPVNLVAPYANGDVTRTERLFKKLYPEIVKRSMTGSYNRERQLMPILLDTEKQGIRASLGTPPRAAEFTTASQPRGELEYDFALYSYALNTADTWLRKKLHAPDLNLDADQDLGNVLDREGVVTDWVWTKGGHGRAPQRSVSKKNLTIANFNNRKVALVHAYRVRLSTCLSMFFESWLTMARESGGFIYCTWNQVRQAVGNDAVGTRTSRLSSTPNFQNIPKDFEDKDDGFIFEDWMGKFLPPLPLMRRYLLPDAGDTWLHRDFNGQELRLLAHFSDGVLADQYRRQPYRNEDGSVRFDPHTTLGRYILQYCNLQLSRGGTKIINFSDIYGKGKANLAESLGVDLETARKLCAAKDALMPDVAELKRAVMARSQAGLPIRTWGGSEIYAEKPGYSEKYGRIMDYHYRMINHLIQRSSAEVTKETVIRYVAHPKRQARFLLTVHDELNASAAKKRLREEMAVLREVMEGIEVDVPMLSDGKYGPNWADIKSYNEPKAKAAGA